MDASSDPRLLTPSHAMMAVSKVMIAKVAASFSLIVARMTPVFQLRGRSGDGTFGGGGQGNLVRCKQPRQIEDDDEASVAVTDAADVVRAPAHADLGCRLDLMRGECQHLEHAIGDEAKHHAAARH